MGEPAKLGEAKDRIRSAFFGLILLLGSWLILNTINPQLTTFKSKLELVEVPTTTEWLLGSAELKPCEFAVLYDQVNWKGNTMTITPDQGVVNLGGLPGFLGGGGRFNLQSYIIYKERDVTTLPCTSPSPPCLDGEDTIENRCVENPDPQSNCKEKYCLLEPCDPKTEHCLCKDGKYYKAGGACVLEAYYESSWWTIKTGGCGDKMASIGAPAVSDLSVHLQNLAPEIRCVRLVQIKTK
jgi:hypothetical protein